MPPAPAAPTTAPVTALIPLRTGGKSRLSGALAPAERAGFVLAMLDDVIAALHGAGLTHIRLLAGGEDALAAAQARGLPALPDPVGEDDAGSADGLLLRRAVDAGLAAVPVDHVRLVVAGDLPLLRASEVTEVLGIDADVVVAPTAGGGTALLRLGPGVVLPTRYGSDSARAHAELARRAGLRVSIVELAGARHDVDAAADLAALSLRLTQDAQGAGRASAAFLARTHG